MTLPTDTARAVARLTKLLDAYKHKSLTSSDPGHHPPAYLPPPKRVDIQLALDVITALSTENERLRHQAILPSWVNGDGMIKADEVIP